MVKRIYDHLLLHNQFEATSEFGCPKFYSEYVLGECVRRGFVIACQETRTSIIAIGSNPLIQHHALCSCLMCCMFRPTVKMSKSYVFVNVMQGPEVRSGDVPQPIILKEGQEFNFTIKRGVSTEDTVSVNYDDFINDVEAGDMLLVDGK